MTKVKILRSLKMQWIRIGEIWQAKVVMMLLLNGKRSRYLWDQQKQQGDSDIDIDTCKCIKRKGENTEKVMNALSNKDYGRQARDYHGYWGLSRLTQQACLIWIGLFLIYKDYPIRLSNLLVKFQVHQAVCRNRKNILSKQAFLYMCIFLFSLAFIPFSQPSHSGIYCLK